MYKKNKHVHTTSMKKIILLGWIAVIFFLSSQPAPISNGLSTNITNIILKDPSLNGYFRESMHMIEFLILGFLMIMLSKKKNYLFTFSVCFILACSDEFFQTFIDGRTCELKDVILDITGAFIGILSYHILTKIKWLTKKVRINF